MFNLKHSLLFLFLIFYIITPAIIPQEKAKLSPAENSSLKSLAGIVHLFSHNNNVWPGCDLSKQKFIYYIPEKWALFMNQQVNIDDFTPYPQYLPELGNKCLFHKGNYKDLEGQLEFGYKIDTMNIVCIGMPEQMIENKEDKELYLFTFITHEAFHQYQSYSFGEIPWAREELYLITDVENISLAYLEVKILEDALRAMFAGDRDKTEYFCRLFSAVRYHRWQTSGSFVPEFEKGLENREGTATYVQIKSLDSFKKLNPSNITNSLARELYTDLDHVSLPDYVFDDMKNRITNNSISPEDMPRNRIYFTASAQGLLLDFLGADWKKTAEKSPETFTYYDYFRNALKYDDAQIPAFVDEAKKLYGYSRINKDAQTQSDLYSANYKKALKEFENSAGTRIEIEFKYSKITRSSNSSEKKLLMDAGKYSLCKEFKLYKLSNDKLSFTLNNSGLLEENDWKGKFKKVSFYSTDLTSVLVNGQTIQPGNKQIEFSELQLKGNNFEFTSKFKGTIEKNGDVIKVKLIEK